MKRRNQIIIGIAIFFTIYSGYILMPRHTPPSIKQLPDELLREASEPVTVFDDNVKEISDELHEVLQTVDVRGSVFKISLGMAAPQIGYNKRIIAVKESYGRYKTMINPELVEKKWLLPMIEGCYSLDGLHITKRYYSSIVKYQDVHGIYHEERAPLIVQQEIDHLNGVLITDY